VAIPEGLSHWAASALKDIAKASHCQEGAVWSLVLIELRALDKQGIRAQGGKRAISQVQRPAAVGVGKKRDKEAKTNNREPSLKDILEEITEDDSSLNWEWPVFEEVAFGTCQTVVTPLLEIDIYCTLDDDTIANVAEDCEVEVSDVLTFSTHFNSSLGADIPSLARCGLDEETLLILRLRRRLRGPRGALVEVKGPPKPARSSRPAALRASSASSSAFAVFAASSESPSNRQASRDPSKDLSSAPELMNGKRARGKINYGPSTASSSSSASSSSLAVSATSSESPPKWKALRDPSKDLRSAPKVMEGKRTRKTINYAGSTSEGGGAERAELGEARKDNDGESDSEDSLPIGKRQKVRKGGDGESDSEDSLPINSGKRQKY
jgi:hypothetical protein